MSRRKVWHVRWRESEGKWLVKRSGSQPSKKFNTKKPAVTNAKAIAKKRPPSMVIVHTKTGSTSASFEYD